MYGDVTNTDQYITENVKQQLIAFVEECQKRNDLTTFLRIIETSEQLSSKHVYQQPERFTEDYLIQPCIEVLGYESIRAKPAEPTHNNVLKPDFSMRGGENTLYILESKKLASFPISFDPFDESDHRVNQINTYLFDDFGNKYSFDGETNIQLGILTDGVRWVVYKPERDEFQPIEYVTIENELVTIINAKLGEGRVSDRWTPELRNNLEKNFTIMRPARTAVK